MNVTREVILDLLPVYLAGEASPATRALVEEYMEQDQELAQRVAPSMGGQPGKDHALRASPGSRVTISPSHARLLGWQRVALWIWNILHRHVMSNEFLV